MIYDCNAEDKYEDFCCRPTLVELGMSTKERGR